MRGTGGLRIVGDDCATTVRGLYAAGDAATRELICGAFTGGGSHNAAWATSSGSWAGLGAARHALASSSSANRPPVRGAGGAGLHGQHEIDTRELVRAVQAEVFPYDRNYHRQGDRLEDSLVRLDQYWRDLQHAVADDVAERARLRQAAAMVATARWMYRSAQARTESRGMHKRNDHKTLDPAQRHYTLSGGLDTVWTAQHRAPWHDYQIAEAAA